MAKSKSSASTPQPGTRPAAAASSPTPPRITGARVSAPPKGQGKVVPSGLRSGAHSTPLMTSVDYGPAVIDPVVLKAPSLSTVRAQNLRNAAAALAQIYDPFSHSGMRWPDACTIPTTTVRHEETQLFGSASDPTRNTWIFGFQMVASPGGNYAYRYVLSGLAGVLTWSAWQPTSIYTSMLANFWLTRLVGAGAFLTFESNPMSLAGTMDVGVTTGEDSTLTDPADCLNNITDLRDQRGWHPPVLQPADDFMKRTAAVLPMQAGGSGTLEGPMNWWQPTYNVTGSPGWPSLGWLYEISKDAIPADVGVPSFRVHMVWNYEAIPYPGVRPIAGVQQLMPGASGEIGDVDAMILSSIGQGTPYLHLATMIAANRVLAELGGWAPVMGPTAHLSGPAEALPALSMTPASRPPLAAGIFGSIGKFFGGAAKDVLGPALKAGAKAALPIAAQEMNPLVMMLLQALLAGSPQELSQHFAALSEFLRTGDEKALLTSPWNSPDRLDRVFRRMGYRRRALPGAPGDIIETSRRIHEMVEDRLNSRGPSEPGSLGAPLIRVNEPDPNNRLAPPGLRRF